MRHPALASSFIVVAMLAVACGGGSGGASNKGVSTPTSPTGSGETSNVAPIAPGGPALDPGCPPSQDPKPCANAKTLTLRITIGGGADWNFNVGGLSFSGTAGSPHYYQIVGLTPGTIEISGQTLASGKLSIGVGIPPSDVGGSIPPSSVQSVEGSACA